MKTLTYKEARDKIWNGYFADKIEPYDAEFCFCGTIGFKEVGHMDFQWDEELYSEPEYGAMEYGLLHTIRVETIGDKYGRDDYVQRVAWRDEVMRHPNYENAIFNGMLAALEVLKQIHRERGEVIPEDEPLLTKRNLPLLL